MRTRITWARWAISGRASRAGLRAPFTAIHARRKMEEAGQDPEQVRVGRTLWPAVVEAGPFTRPVRAVSHSIPEASALSSTRPRGAWCIPATSRSTMTPVVGEAFDPDVPRDREWRREGFICDSTNVFSRHEGRSESQLAEPDRQADRRGAGMVVATTFASNVARLKTLADAGVAQGRSICLLGRAMKRMVDGGGGGRRPDDFPRTLSPEEATEVPRDNLMLIVTGSQGERRAASAALSRGSYLGHELKEGDLFLFSSKTIPGNEVSVARIQNALAEKGVLIADDASGFYHVSGHANRPDIEAMHDILRPQIVVPNHGEYRHLAEHTRLALSKGMTGIVAANGSMVELSGNAPQVVEYHEVGRTYLDGTALIGAFDGIIRDRMKLALNGIVIVALIVDEEDEILEDAWVALRGLPETGAQGGDLAQMIEEELAQTLPRLSARTIEDDDKLEEAVKRVARDVCVSEIGKKPEVTVLVSRLMAE
jgi:ribonuclease J